LPLLVFHAVHSRSVTRDCRYSLVANTVAVPVVREEKLDVKVRKLTYFLSVCPSRACYCSNKSGIGFASNIFVFSPLGKRSNGRRRQARWRARNRRRSSCVAALALRVLGVTSQLRVVYVPLSPFDPQTQICTRSDHLRYPRENEAINDVS
jgi:hypothetical protein